MSDMRGIRFVDIATGGYKHTATTWNLIMSEKVIGIPRPRIVKVDMADRNGAIDLSEVNLGRVSYENRALSFSFICTDPQPTWAALVTNIAQWVHGKRMMIIDPDTPDHYYIGRCTLHDPTYIGEAIMFLTVTVDADPIRWRRKETTVVEDVSAGDTLRLATEGESVIPTITVSANMTIAFGEYSFSLTGGTSYRIPEITLKHGSMNTITITVGSGTITFVYRQGEI